MKKIIILALGLSFLAASCDTGSVFDFGGGVRGVFKSEDSAETFTAANKLKKGDISAVAINALTLDPSNPSILYAATTGGIYKTEDGAKSWKYILTGIRVADIAVDSFSSSTVYASGSVGENGKIIKSTDGGTTWTDVYTEPSKNNAAVALGLSKISSGLVLAGLGSGELLRSADAGKTWQTMKDFSDRVIDIKFGPTNTAYALTSTSGIHKSDDAGITWTNITDSLTTETFNSINRNVSSVTAFYDLALDYKQTGVLYLGTEQGLFRSINDGKDWAFLALPLKNAALRVSAVVVDPTNSNNVFCSVASTVYKSINGGLTWETRTLNTAPVHTIIIDPNSTNNVYLGLRN